MSTSRTAARDGRPSVAFEGDRLIVPFGRFDLTAYDLFLKAKAIPEYECQFDEVTETYRIVAPARFATMLGVERPAATVGDLPLAPHIYDDQRWIVLAALDARRFAVWSDCGLGKGQPADAPVLTPSGWRPIGSLAVGDRVIASDGRAASVTGVFPKPEQDTYRVHFSDGVSFVVDADHLHICRTNNDRRRGRPWRVLSTADLLSCGNLRYGDGGKSRNYDIPVVADVEFQAADLPIDPYVLGVLLGDGHIDGNIAVSSADPEIVEAVAAGLPRGVELALRGRYDWKIMTGGCRGPRMGRHPFRVAIEGLGLLGTRSDDKFVPAPYLFAAPGDRLRLLRGLMDTDGYIAPDGTCQFYSVSGRLADGVVHLVRSLGGVPTRSIKRTSCGGKPCRPCHVVTFSLATHNPFSLPRKAGRWNPSPRDNGRWIDRIEFETRQPTVCIAVDSPDSSYVTEHFIVTHNTMIELEFARQVHHRTGGRVLIVTLNEIVGQLLAEAARFYPELPILRIGSQSELIEWASDGSGVALTNYEKFNPRGLPDGVIPNLGTLAGIVLDESSRLKGGGASKQKKVLNASCAGIEYKLSCTATPAPNDTIEFVSQATFLEKVRTDADIIWTYFTRDSKTHRRTVKPHARAAFFDFMATWSVYLKHPERFGWRVGMPKVPDPEYLTHPLEATPEQMALLREVLGGDSPLLFATREPNAIERSKLAQIARGFIYRKKVTGRGVEHEQYWRSPKGRAVERVPSAKPGFVADLIRAEVAAGHQTLCWTVFDEESAILAELLEGSPFSLALLTGETREAERVELLERFRAGGLDCLISRPRMLGYGLNFQACTSMIFSGFTESFEELYQAIRRAVRHGQDATVRVHFPVVEALEGDTFANLRRKSAEHERATSEMEDNYLRSFRNLKLGATA